MCSVQDDEANFPTNERNPGLVCEHYPVITCFLILSLTQLLLLVARGHDQEAVGRQTIKVPTLLWSDV